MRHSSRDVRGFTLIELLVVIAIIAILIALLVPAVQKVREAANRSTCQNNLKQLSLGINGYHDARAEYPPVRVAGGLGWATWYVLILPYIEKGDVYNQWDLTKCYQVQSVAAQQARSPVFYCPTRRNGQELSLPQSWDVNDSTPLPGSTSSMEARFNSANNPPGSVADYAANVGDMRGTPNNPNAENWFNTSSNGALILATATPNPTTTSPPTFIVNTFKSNTKSKSIIDGTSNTILLGEKHVPLGYLGYLRVGDGPAFSGAWTCFSGRIGGIEDPLGTGPKDQTPSTGAVDGIYARKFGSWHPGICQFGFCDGSVRVLPISIDTTNLRRLTVRNDGEVSTFVE